MVVILFMGTMPQLHVTGLTQPSLITSIPLFTPLIITTKTTGPPSRFEPSTQSSVFFFGHEQKVFNPIITPDPIDMMDLFILGQITTQETFHYNTMFANITITVTVGVVMSKQFNIPMINSPQESSQCEVSGNGEI